MMNIKKRYFQGLVKTSPSDGWHRTNLVLGSSTPSRREGTSPRAQGQLMEEPESLDAVLRQDEEEGAMRKRKKPGQDSPCSRTGHEWRTVPPGTQWC